MKPLKKHILRSGARLTTRFSAERRHTAERLNNIMDGRRKSAALPLIAAILLCSLLSGMIVSCRPQSNPPEVPTDPVTDPVTDPATDPVTDPVTDPAGTEPVTDAPLTVEEIIQLYENAMPLWMLFYGSSEGEGSEKIVQNYLTYNNDTKFGTMDALRASLSAVFTDEVIEDLLSLGCYTEHDGRLWVLSHARGTDIRCGNTVVYHVSAFTEDTIEVSRTVDVEDILEKGDDAFERMKIGESVQKLTLVLRDGKWLFDSFTSFDDLSEYDSRHPLDIQRTTDLHDFFAGMSQEEKDFLLYSEEDYAKVADRLLHPDAHRSELDDDYYALYSSMNITEHYFQYSSDTHTIYLTIKADGNVPAYMNKGWNTLRFEATLASLHLVFLPDYNHSFEVEDAFHLYNEVVWITDLPNSADELKGYDFTLFCEYIIGRLGAKGDDHVTLAEFRAYAEKCFGIADLTPGTQNYDAATDTCWISGHGGNAIAYSIRDIYEDGGIYTLNVQYFADFGCQIPSHLVSYRMQKTDGDWVFLSSERLFTAAREPARYSV